MRIFRFTFLGHRPILGSYNKYISRLHEIKDSRKWFCLQKGRKFDKGKIGCNIKWTERTILLYDKLQRPKCQLQRRDGNPGGAPLSQGGSSVFKDRPIVNTNIDVPIIGRGSNDGDGFRCQRKPVVRPVRWSVRARIAFGRVSGRKEVFRRGWWLDILENLNHINFRLPAADWAAYRAEQRMRRWWTTRGRRVLDLCTARYERSDDAETRGSKLRSAEVSVVVVVVDSTGNTWVACKGVEGVRKIENLWN